MQKKLSPEKSSESAGQIEGQDQRILDDVLLALGVPSFSVAESPDMTKILANREDSFG
jgi:hypothetical protein